jgi:hypothetical protein
VEQKFPKEAAELKAKLKQYRMERVSRIEVILNTALASSNPPSIATLASQAGFSPGYIRECSPELSKKLCDLRRAVKPQVVIRRKQKLSAQIRGAALALHSRGEYPSLGNVRRELGWQRKRKIEDFIRVVLKEIRAELGIPTARFGPA